MGGKLYVRKSTPFAARSCSGNRITLNIVTYWAVKIKPKAPPRARRRIWVFRADVIMRVFLYETVRLSIDSTNAQRRAAHAKIHEAFRPSYIGPAGILDLREAWGRSLPTAAPRIFSSWEWLFTWWEYYGGGRRLFIVVLYLHDKPVAVFPILFPPQVSLHAAVDAVIPSGRIIPPPITWTLSFGAVWKSPPSRSGSAILRREREWAFIELKDIAGESHYIQS